MSTLVRFEHNSANARYGYMFQAMGALLSGAATAALIVQEKWVFATLFYATATTLRLVGGWLMNRMGDAETVNAWYNKYHRFVVIALNGGVGGMLLGCLAWDALYHSHVGPFAFLCAAFITYFIASKFTAPNTFGVRVRSATLTVVLLGTMAYLAWPGQWGVCVLYGVIALIFVCFRLSILQRRFGWADR